MSETLATCLICGKKYNACLSCKEKMRLTPWKVVVDSPECWKLYCTVDAYRTKKISREEAKAQIGHVKFNKENLTESIRKKIEEINGDDEPKPETGRAKRPARRKNSKNRE